MHDDEALLARCLAYNYGIYDGVLSGCGSSRSGTSGNAACYRYWARCNGNSWGGTQSGRPSRCSVAWSHGICGRYAGAIAARS